jgi:hypothetical protein
VYTAAQLNQQFITNTDQMQRVLFTLSEDLEIDNPSANLGETLVPEITLSFGIAEMWQLTFCIVGDSNDGNFWSQGIRIEPDVAVVTAIDTGHLATDGTTYVSNMWSRYGSPTGVYGNSANMWPFGTAKMPHVVQALIVTTAACTMTYTCTTNATGNVFIYAGTTILGTKVTL